MKWAHLPVAGGLYDQHPKLMDEWDIIFEVKAQHDKAEEAKNKPKTPTPGRR